MGCCCGPSQDDACGWPKNTIRAILAVLIVLIGFGIAAATIALLITNNRITEAVAVLGSIFAIVGVITTFYFSSQSAAATTKIISDAAHQLVESKNSELNHMRELNRGLNRGIRRGRNIRRSREQLVEMNDEDADDPVIVVA